MKRTILFLSLLASISAISGYLMSKASWIGRVGMTFFYKEYNLLKIWWQGALAVFIIFIFLYALHALVQLRFNQLRLSQAASKVVHAIVLAVTITGLYFTYDDFSTDLSHRLLGWRFHYGVYLFWVGWMFICLNFLFKKKPPTDFPIDPNSKAQAGQ
jgi:hypothetical protein